MNRSSEQLQTVNKLVELFKPFNKVCATCTTSCCSNCAANHGYFINAVTTQREEINELKQSFGWTSDKGFLGPEGCKLPHELRSATCLTFACGNLLLEMSNNLPAFETKVATVEVIAKELNKALEVLIKTRD